MRSSTPRIRITASVIGVLLGLSGMLNHGIFEILQGNTPTNGFFIEAIGEAQRYWVHGTEAAITLVPNFLATGILAVLTGLAVIIWSIGYMHTKHGTTVFFVLIVLLTLFGGGIGYLLLFLPSWAFATRMNRPLGWWDRALPAGLKRALAALWPYTLAATALAWLMLMQMGIFGYFPGQSDPDTILSIVFIFLFSSTILACISFVGAISGELEEGA